MMVYSGARRSVRVPYATSCRSCCQKSCRIICSSTSWASVRHSLRTIVRSPNRRAAASRAASGESPSSSSRLTSISMCSVSSSSTSSSTERRQKRRAPERSNCRIVRSGRSEDARHRFYHHVPLRRLRPQFGATSGRQGIDANAFPDVRFAPSRLDPAALLHAVEGGVERSFLDAHDVVGRFLDPARDRVAMTRPPGKGLEDEEIERALQDASIGVGHGRTLWRAYLERQGMGALRVLQRDPNHFGERSVIGEPRGGSRRQEAGNREGTKRFTKVSLARREGSLLALPTPLSLRKNATLRGGMLTDATDDAATFGL